MRGLTHSSATPIMRFLMQDAKTFAASSKESAAAYPQLVNLEENQPDEPNLDAPGIPALIFQTWKSKSSMPENYAIWRATYFRENPSYRIILWDDHDNRSFMERHFPWFMPVYDRYPREIYRVDAVRIFFLFYYGGFYADMDAECVRPLDHLLGIRAPVLGRMGGDAGFDQSLPNAIMASEPRHIFWLYVVKLLSEKMVDQSQQTILDRGPEFYTGPIVLKEAFDRFSALSEEEAWRACGPLIEHLPDHMAQHLRYSPITVLDADEWYPVDWTNPVHRALRKRLMDNEIVLDAKTVKTLFPRASMVTYWSKSWGSSVINQ